MKNKLKKIKKYFSFEYSETFTDKIIEILTKTWMGILIVILILSIFITISHIF